MDKSWELGLMESYRVKAGSEYYACFTSAVRSETFIMEYGSGSSVLVCDSL